MSHSAKPKIHKKIEKRSFEEQISPNSGWFLPGGVNHTSTHQTWPLLAPCRPRISTYLFIMIIFLSFCNIVISQNNADEMLLDLKVDFKNTGALDSSWIKGSNPCDPNRKWAGVFCRDGVVRALRLKGYNLSGVFNAGAIANLNSLRTINIANNDFSGPMPEFYLIDGLRDLLVNGNKFTGEIVPTFFAIKQPSRLRILDLSSNGFSGKIPESLVSIPNLQELYLQHNGFSGNVPLFSQQSLNKVDLSFNKLEGEIPEAMAVKFGAESFAENPGLCSPKIGKQCLNNALGNANSPESYSSIKWIFLGLIVVIFVVTLVLISQKHKNSFHMLKRVNDDHNGVHMQKATSRKTSSINKRGGQVKSTSRKSSHNERGTSELIIVNDERGTFGLPDLMKANAEVLGNGALGSAYKAVMQNGVSVVVKRLKDMNKMQRDEFYMEMRHLGGLRHKNILPPLAYHYRKEEKLIVSEYVPKGSLLYLLHGDRGVAHSELTWPIRLKIIKGVAQGLAFLHSEFSTYELPHGNLKSSNILISSDYEPLLSDYAFHPMFSITQAQTLFAYRSPEVALTQQVSPKSDVFCLGIVILEVLTGKIPSQYLNNQKGGTDIVQWARTAVSEKREAEFIDPEIASAQSSSIVEMVKLLHVGVDCTNNEHHTRLHLNEAINRIADIHT